MVEVVKDMVVEDTHVSQLSLWMSIDRKLRSDETASKQLMGQLVAHVFGSVSGGASRPELGPLRMGTVHLECPYYLKDFEIEAICSALAANQTSKKLSMRLQMAHDDPAASRHWWRWLAYGLFSKRARAHSSLEDLSLISIGRITEEDVEEFSAILNSEHPEEDLYGCPRGKLDERNAVLKAGAPVYYRFNNRGQPRRDTRPLTFEGDIASVRTFSDDGVCELVDVMVPGFGRCQVQRSDLVFAESTDEEGSAGGVTSLHIGLEKFDPYEADGLPQFIAVVGPSLKFLALNDARGEIDENWIIRSCPNLEELAMYGGDGVDMRFNFSDYHANGLPLPDLTCDWHDVAALSAQLGNSNNPLAKCVRRLRVRLVELVNAWMFPDRQHFENILSGLLQMLEANQTLEYLDIVTPVRHSSELVASFQKHHLEPTNRALILPIESKLAFLSVLTPRHMATKTVKTRKRRALPTIRGYYQLDQHVLSRILQFAAPRVLREVYLHGSHDDGPMGELLDIPI